MAANIPAPIRVSTIKFALEISCRKPDEVTRQIQSVTMNKRRSCGEIAALALD
jgi:hypothetical protein